MILFWTYLAGLIVSLVYVGSRWDETDWNDVGPLPVLGAILWPLMAPMVAGRTVARVRAARQERREQIAEERKRWLAAPLPAEVDQ